MWVIIFHLWILFISLPTLMLIGLDGPTHIILPQGGTCISWFVHFTEDEYCVVSFACSKILWLQELLFELGLPQTGATSMRITLVPHRKYSQCSLQWAYQTYPSFPFYPWCLWSRHYCSPTRSIQSSNIDIFTKVLMCGCYQFFTHKLMLIDFPHQWFPFVGA